LFVIETEFHGLYKIPRLKVNEYGNSFRPTNGAGVFLVLRSSHTGYRKTNSGLILVRHQMRY